ncbi:cytochrome c oxidase assembly protein [Terricaulis sp.]|uniref:cytochrome c oxidase assembly protein n=1 Tax=Terricaulis sp. TaxID=2768686 RepID=UPI003783A786
MIPADKKKRVALTAAIAIGAVVGMTGMAFAAVPLYRAFCQLTGYGGTTQTASGAPTQVLAEQVLVRFDTNVAQDLPVRFSPPAQPERLHIGETGLAYFTVKNLSNEPVTARASYNVVPHTAGKYFVKLECFCFQDRVLAPGEEAQLPVVYFVAPEIVSDPETASIRNVTLSYTFMRTREGQGETQAGQTPEG